MILTLELSEDEAERVRFAQARGIDVSILLRGLISALPLDSAEDFETGAPSDITKIINRLKEIAIRPFVFLGDENPTTAQTYLHGFQAACRAFGLGTFQYEPFLARSQLWEANRYAADKETIPQMQARGMSDREMVDAIFAVEIDYWKSLAKSLQ